MTVTVERLPTNNGLKKIADIPRGSYFTIPNTYNFLFLKIGDPPNRANFQLNHFTLIEHNQALEGKCALIVNPANIQMDIKFSV